MAPNSRTSRRALKQPPKKNQTPTTVMFVPNTPKGVLLSLMKEREVELSAMSEFRVRYVEAGGTSLTSMFSTNPRSGKHCGRACIVCAQPGDRKEDCTATSIVYESACLLCNPEEQSRHRSKSRNMKGVEEIMPTI